MTQTIDDSGLAHALAALAHGASERDETGAGLDAALRLLETSGLLAWNAVLGSDRPAAAAELGFVRAVARADSSVGRVLDGHFNGIERLAVQGPGDVAHAEFGLVRAGLLRVGVWGGDPRSSEGNPASIECDRFGAEFLTGVKTFCSGAGSLDRAAVLARDSTRDPAPGGLPVLVWIDLRDTLTVEVDERWYRTAGLRASASHRVVFRRAPVLARLGSAGAISDQPWLGRDALRTSASWAGMVDRAIQAAIDDLKDRPQRTAVEELAVGRMIGAQRTIDMWLEGAARAMDDAVSDLWDVALHARVAIAAAARTVLDEAARACGSHPFATGGDLDRVRRDLELFLLQHRLEPSLVRAGAQRLAALDREREQGAS